MRARRRRMQPPGAAAAGRRAAAAGVGHARRGRRVAAGARRPRPLGRAAHLRAERARSVLRPGLRAGPGPSVSDGPLAPVGPGPAVGGAGPEFRRTRCGDAAGAVSRRRRSRVGGLWTGCEAHRRGVRARRQRVGGHRARARAGGVHAGGLAAGTLEPGGSAEPDRRFCRQRGRRAGRVPRTPGGRSRRAARRRVVSGRDAVQDSGRRRSQPT